MTEPLQLAQTDVLHLLRLPMCRQTSQTQSKQTERFLNFKCKNCNGEFASSRSYDSHRRSHRRHRNVGGRFAQVCRDESSKSEITFAGCAGLTTGILMQHSLANAKLGESLTLHIFTDLFTYIDQITQINKKNYPIIIQ